MGVVGKVITGFLGLLLCSHLHATVVLQYHHVSDKTPPSTSVTPELFEKHLDYLESQGLRVASLPDVIAKLKKGEPLPDKTVVLTFDDAYESVYTVAFPLMKARDLPFTVFVNTDPIDKKRRGFVTWEQMREMAEHGGTIANHTADHTFMPRLREGESRAQWRERIKAEVMVAEKRIEEETGQSHKVLAYPYGEFDNNVKALLDELGFIAFAQNSGPLGQHSDLLALPRFPFGGVFGAPDDFALKANTRPMPVSEVARCSDRRCRQTLDDVVVAQGDRPVLAITLKQENVLPSINCFASRQGAIETWVDGNTLYTRANEPLSPGRTQYNCTAPSGERGRFFWLSQQWLVTDKDGNWVHQD
ncbi:polysaccharide deacetylase family protein [Marinimicrobium sp. ABcell2]|uniref:polysaccharide deacetylase family protein n=1 Tax=Marinimicrobium sp. ABcell2 TaxID=3069751 RepID=UPI0027B04215|nr:polysaccharide deacetylase family protein [Marinimicrobium sp. ABcell2]MDQ2076494.1 polysaccharide deacetylase family protein [Marinimicrobium sp. ABcell2]